MAKPCEHCGRGGTDLLELLEHYNHHETELEWDDVDQQISDLKAEATAWYGRGCETEQREFLITKLNAAKQHFEQVFGVCVSYTDIFLNKLIKEMAKTGEITVVKKEHE